MRVICQNIEMATINSGVQENLIRRKSWIDADIAIEEILKYGLLFIWQAVKHLMCVKTPVI